MSRPDLKTVLTVYRCETEIWQRLIEEIIEEISPKYDNKIKIIHFHSPLAAFDYMVSYEVDLVISEILLEEIELLEGQKIDDIVDRYEYALSGKTEITGIQLLNACKTRYPQLPFILFGAWDYSLVSRLIKDRAPDVYIQASTDVTEMRFAIERLLNTEFGTAVVNSNLRANDVNMLVPSK